MAIDQENIRFLGIFLWTPNRINRIFIAVAETNGKRTGDETMNAKAEAIKVVALKEHADRFAGARAKGLDATKEAIVAANEAKVARMAEISDERWWMAFGPMAPMTRIVCVDWVYRGGQWLDADGKPAQY
jgi:hypothetical protein